MYGTPKIQLMILFSVILFMYSLMAIQYHIWKASDGRQMRHNILSMNKNNRFTLLKENIGNQKRKLKTTLNSKADNVVNLRLKPANNINYKILIWQGYSLNERHSFGNCQFTNCQVTFNKSQVVTSDAIVISINKGVINTEGLPEHKPRHQKWILFTMESTALNNAVLEKYNGVFNALASYRQFSDITIPYGEVIHRNTPINLSHGNYIKGKTKLVAVLYNCDSRSNEEHYIRELRKYVPVDAYNLCQWKNCLNSENKRNNSNECFKAIAKKYKFCILFKSSLCKENVPDHEALWNILKMDIVPAVSGLINYSQILPPHSYIDLQDFQSAKELAEFFKLLDNHTRIYNGYFLWKRYYYINLWSTEHLLCKCCEYMNQGKMKTYHDIQNLLHEGKCVP